MYIIVVGSVPIIVKIRHNNVGNEFALIVSSYLTIVKMYLL